MVPEGKPDKTLGIAIRLFGLYCVFLAVLGVIDLAISGLGLIRLEAMAQAFEQELGRMSHPAPARTESSPEPVPTFSDQARKVAQLEMADTGVKALFHALVGLYCLRGGAFFFWLAGERRDIDRASPPTARTSG